MQFAAVTSSHVAATSPGQQAEVKNGLQALARFEQGQAVRMPPVERMRALERVSRIRELAMADWWQGRETKREGWTR